MKYLLALLLLVGCDSEPTNHITREQWQAQIQEGKELFKKIENKCYVAWEGTIYTFVADSKQVDGSDPVGLNVCAIYKECDYQNSKKCVNAMHCGRWINFAILKEEFEKLKASKCPGRNK